MRSSSKLFAGIGILSILVLAIFMMMRSGFLTMLLLSLQMSASIQTSGTNKLPYRLYIPSSTQGEKVPLVLVLHSAAGRGNNNFGQLEIPVSHFVSGKSQKIQKAFVLAPQSPKNMLWSSEEFSSPPFENLNLELLEQSWRETLIIELIDKLVAQHNIDPARIYITGFSMGADGVWDILYRFPGIFAGAIILNGHTDPGQAATIAKTPIRLFHGKKDTLYPVKNSIQMEAALDAINADVDLTILDAGHDIRELVYNDSLYRWLMTQRKSSTQ